MGIESSCDETAAAVIENGERLLSNVVNSQIDIHAEYGGVIPEIAARSHLEVVNPVIRTALEEANCTWDDIDAIAVTYAPGLIGSLLVGTLAARTLAVLHDKPLYKIHHVEAHVYANFITKQILSSDRNTKSPEASAQPTASTSLRGGCENDPERGFSRTLDESASSTLEKSVLREDDVVGLAGDNKAVSDDLGSEIGNSEDKKQTSEIKNLDWQQVLDQAKTTSSGLYTLLNKCSYKIEGNKLTLYAGTKFAAKKLDDSKFRPIISEIIQKSAKTDVDIIIVGDKKPPEDKQLAEIAAMMGGGEEVKLDELETAK